MSRVRAPSITLIEKHAERFPFITQNQGDSMPDATLMELLKEVRWKTLKVLEDVNDDQAR
jgi:hypothetical protein